MMTEYELQVLLAICSLALLAIIVGFLRRKAANFSFLVLRLSNRTERKSIVDGAAQTPADEAELSTPVAPSEKPDNHPLIPAVENCRTASHRSGLGSVEVLPENFDDLVEIGVEGPTHAPALSRISFEVPMSIYRQDRGGANTDANLAETVVTEMKRGSQVALAFESSGLVLDSWLGVAVWDGRPIAPPFSATTPATRASLEVKNTIHIIVASTPIGSIDFETHIVSGLRAPANLVRVATRTFLGSAFKTDSPELVVELQGRAAFRYRRAFLSYAREDLRPVSYFAQGLAAAQIEVLADLASFDLGETWHAQAAELIKNSDVVYLCWSAAASRSDNVRRELDFAQEMLDLRGKPKIVPIFVDDKVSSLPYGLSEHNALTKWNLIRAGSVATFGR